VPQKKDTDKQKTKEVITEKEEVASDEDNDAEDVNRNKKEKQKGKYSKREEVVAAVAKV
jgi:hypothetical protein